jgi:hypothetical protein
MKTPKAEDLYSFDSSVTVYTIGNYKCNHIYQRYDFINYIEAKVAREGDTLRSLGLGSAWIMERLIHFSDKPKLSLSAIKNHETTDGWYTGFQNKNHAKIWIAQQRLEWLFKFYQLNPNNPNNPNQKFNSITGEIDKTTKWLEKMSHRYPEYWL